MDLDKIIYCQSNEEFCECGKAGMEIVNCRKPFSPDKMQEIFDEMRQRQTDVPFQ